MGCIFTFHMRILTFAQGRTFHLYTRVRTGIHTHTYLHRDASFTHVNSQNTHRAGRAHDRHPFEKQSCACCGLVVHQCLCVVLPHCYLALYGVEFYVESSIPHLEIARVLG
jgi:hypothetical protein